MLTAGFPTPAPSPVPVPVTGPVSLNSSPTIYASFLQAGDLNQYTSSQLSAVHQWVVAYNNGQSPQQLAAEVGASDAGPTGLIQNTDIFSFPSSVPAAAAAIDLEGLPGVIFYPLVYQNYITMSGSTSSSFPTTNPTPNDPLFSQEWELHNTGQTGGLVGADANVEPAWQAGDLGKGVVVGVVDSGVYAGHPDLIANYDASLSYNFVEQIPNATPPVPLTSGQDHGTEVAGVIAAVGNNGIGVAGAAPDATLAGIRLISGTPLSGQTVATALNFQDQKIDVYNNSWGPATTQVGILSPADPLVLAAIQNASINGRGGLGNVYTFASGDGLQGQSDVNYNELASSPFVIAVGGVNDKGTQTQYADPGYALLVSGYTGNGLPGASGEHGVPTTDVINNTSTTPVSLEGTYLHDDANGFSGTSASTALVSGVIALMLEANPNLSYRDVQMILAESATMTDPKDLGWVTNGASWFDNNHQLHPFNYNPSFGFGAVNAAQAVELAKTWTPLEPLEQLSSTVIDVAQSPVPGDPGGVPSSVTFTASLHVEHVEVILDATAPVREDLRIRLVSPDGTQSILASPRTTDTSTGDATGKPNSDYTGWVFDTAADMGENAQGTWTLYVADPTSDGVVSVFKDWQLVIFGSTHYSPRANDVTTSTNENTAVQVPVLNTDFALDDATIDPTTVTVVNQPAHGTVAVDPTTGVVTYTPAFLFNGTDTFTYTVADSFGAVSRVATATIVVVPVPVPPVAGNVSAQTSPGQAVNIDVLAADTDVDATISPSSVTIVTPPQFGTATVDPVTGLITYTPNPSFTFNDSFTYTVSDSLGAVSLPGTVSISRIDVPPTAGNVVAFASKNQTQAINVLLDDTSNSYPIKPGSVAIVAPPQFGTATIDHVTGLINYTPAVNFFGSDSLTYDVADTAGGVSNAATVSITVENNGPPLALNHQFVLVPSFNGVLGISALDNPTNTGTLTASVVQTTSLGTLELASNGTFRYLPGPNFHGLDSFSYLVNDGVQNSNVATIRLASTNFTYVARLYQDVLQRQGSDAEILFWTNVLNQGAAPSQVALAIAGSAEGLGLEVNALYEQLLNRPADAGGLSYWVGQLQAGASVEAVTAAIATSGEFFFDHGGSQSGFVNGLYQTLLGRTASAEEVSFWVSTLNSGVSPTGVALDFLKSTEYRARVINGYYESYLGHAADPGGLEFWLFLYSATGGRTSVQVGILTSREFMLLSQG